MNTTDFAVTVDRPMPEAQAQILDRIAPRLRSAGFRQRANGNAVVFRPRFVGLLIVWAIRRLQDEHVTFTFEEHGRSTEVRVTGKLRQRAHAEVTRAFPPGCSGWIMRGGGVTSASQPDPGRECRDLRALLREVR
jgi:hypothetical protein